MDKIFNVKNGYIHVQDTALIINDGTGAKSLLYDEITETKLKKPRFFRSGFFIVNSTRGVFTLPLKFEDGDLFVRIKDFTDSHARINAYKDGTLRTTIVEKSNIFSRLLGLLTIIVGLVCFIIGLMFCLTIIGLLIGVPVLLGGIYAIIFGIVLFLPRSTGTCPLCGNAFTTFRTTKGIDCQACKERLVRQEGYFEIINRKKQPA